MIVRVELHSAVTREVTEIARMHIANVGGSRTAGDYEAATLRGRDSGTLDRGNITRQGKVLGHQRLALHVWHLVAKALSGMGYGK